MDDTTPKQRLWPHKLWALGCSLKLAIALASLTTVLIMGGSLLMHFNPSVFASMDQRTMIDWLPQAMTRAPLLVAWVPLSGLCTLLFAINTLCCLIDWLFKIKLRWRKSGEYLIHLGFILLVIAYCWGNLAGFRSGPHKLLPGQRINIPNMPGYALQLDEFTPKTEPSGRPLDMLNLVSLWKNGSRAVQTMVRMNHPLIYDSLIVLPTSYGLEMSGFRFYLQGRGSVDLSSGSRIQLAQERVLVINRVLPDARQNSRGETVQVSNTIGNPAIHLSLVRSNSSRWSGWYFLRQPLPEELTDEGITLQPIEPIFTTYSLLTINRDPGDKLALIGGICITAGVLFAFFSFYRKRAQGDRPEV